jgi:hypothetical protein
MAADEVILKFLELVIGNVYVGKLSKSGIDAVNNSP